MAGPPASRFLYDAAQVPPQGLITSLFPQLLGPGQFQGCSGFRWNNGVVSVRLGITKIIAALPVAGATPIDLGTFELNGIQYLIGAFAVSSQIAFYVSTTPFTSWTEITDASGSWTGDTSGNSRMATVSERVTFAQVRTPAETVVSAGVANVLPSRDVGILCNGENPACIYDPAGDAGLKFLWHTPLVLPTNYDKFQALPTFSVFFQIAGTTITPFASAGPPKVNQTNYTITNTSAAPYTSTNICALFTRGTSVGTTDIATLRGTASGGKQIGDKLIFLVEGNLAPSIFSQAKLRTNPDGSNAYNSVTKAFQNVYDPTLPAQAYRFSIIPLDLTGSATSRYFIVYDMTHLTVGQRLTAHFEFTNTGAAPSAAQSCVILGIFSSGTIPGGAEWSLTYGDIYSRWESPGIDSTLVFEDLSNVGGPSVVTGATLAPYLIPVVGQISYDFTLQPANAEGADILAGGLAGQPNRANFYLRVPGPDGSLEPTPYFLFGVVLYNAGISLNFGGATIPKGWYKNFTGSPFTISNVTSSSGFLITTSAAHNFVTGDYVFISGVIGTGGLPAAANGYWLVTYVSATTFRLATSVFVGAYTSGGLATPALKKLSISTASGGLTAGNRNFERLLPGPSQIGIPVGAICYGDGQRLYVGAIKANSQKSLGDLYFSRLNMPFRFSPDNLDWTQTVVDPAAGSLVVLGKPINAIAGGASSAEGQGYVYVWTSQSVFSLGGSSGIAAGPADSESLSVAVRIANTGTLCGRSVCEDQGVHYWIDSQFQVRGLMNGVTRDISRSRVDDQIKAIPAARRLKAGGACFNGRFYMPYTAPGDLAGDAVNTRVLVFNPYLGQSGQWEAMDRDLPFHPERMVKVYDSANTGSGQRLLSLGSDGFLYAYEEGATDLGAGVAVRLASPEWVAPAENFVIVTNAVVIADHQASTMTFNLTYRSADQTGTYTFAGSLAKGWVNFNGKHAAVSPFTNTTGDTTDEAGSSVSVELTGTMTAGTKLVSVLLNFTYSSSHGAYGTA